MTYTTRREFLSALALASIPSILPASTQGRNRAGYSAPRLDKRDFGPVRERILKEIAAGSATGAAVAVVHKGRIIWEEGFGWANREAAVKATSRTPFNLASLTKPFTTTMLMALVAEGKLSLDDPANKYLAKSKIIGTNGNADVATVRQLGAHVSGLPKMFAMYDRNEANLALSSEALLAEYGSLAYPPGSCYEYSNIGFAALSAIASNLTGVEIGPLITQRVLTPLGLDDSFFDTDVTRLSTGAARYDSSGNPIPYYTTATPASGELYASAHDLARFAMFNMNNRDRARILDDRWMEELHKPVFVGPSGVATTFGWFTQHLKSGEQVLFKGGGQPGVATALRMVPAEDLACLVLTNRSDGDELCQSICNEILSSYLPEWRQPEDNSGPSPSPFVITPELSGHWQGTLTNDGMQMQVRLHIESSDSATLQLGQKPAEKIIEMHLEGIGFTGTSTGVIESPDVIRTGAKTLNLKLIPHEGKLVGRILATDSKTVTLPYVLGLKRASA
ncbi:serine hydrolase domain-containing protein [Acidicapsa dinghuensis]|uniref:Serine hydrolase domain-containing protein n=1 Tax=Acidicapsa dinghuensis TaxID=2218256 RepID=A0ABW1EJJ2_9BACT|nr:serine hydrolase domain-containing protein [Acidicapsa dinghuensis]